jgi:sterol desaturase/sphingolipid hydroxylase (fatty acid hydroxylase superfamily)
LLTAICSLLEFLGSRGPMSLKNILFNLACGAIALSMLYGINLTIEPALAKLRAHALLPVDYPKWSRLARAGLALGALFTWDFLQYWAHRAEHHFPWLWRFHLLHHSDRDVCGSTSARNHLFNHLTNIVCITVPMAVLFPNTPLPAWCTFIFFWCYGYFNHTMLWIDLGPLTPVFSGPRFHRAHHGAAKIYHDKNFAAFFPILDVVFGTYYKPAKDEYIETGVEGCDAPNSLASVTIEPILPAARPVASRPVPQVVES